MGKRGWFYLGCCPTSENGLGIHHLLAALTAIDPALYEAAELTAPTAGGAWPITLPGICPTISVSRILSPRHPQRGF